MERSPIVWWAFVEVAKKTERSPIFLAGFSGGRKVVGALAIFSVGVPRGREADGALANFLAVFLEIAKRRELLQAYLQMFCGIYSRAG